MLTDKHMRRDKSVASRHKDTGLSYQARYANRVARRQTRALITQELLMATEHLKYQGTEEFDAATELTIYELDLLMLVEWQAEREEWDRIVKEWSYYSDTDYDFREPVPVEDWAAGL